MDASSTKTKMSHSRKASNKVNKKHDVGGKQTNKKHDDAVKPGSGCFTSWICKNASCRAVVSKDDSFCRRCSCCICHNFDENKDPSLWLVCEPEKSGDPEFCGLSCHLECAFRENKVGVTGLGKLMRLDGSYCCYSCGKVSGILRCWKKQLMAAKEARRRDVLCCRIDLSYRLLNGTSRYCELHEIVRAAKSKLEAEVGPLDGASARTDRGIVSRLPVASEVQELCTSAIKKAEDLSVNAAGDSVPAACKFQFEDITPTQVTLRLIELPSATENDIKGYKLWYFKKGDIPEDDLFIDCGRTERRMVISNLEPCTEYTFRVLSHRETGLLGHSNVRCFTKSIEILQISDDSVDRRKKRRLDLGNQPSEREEKRNISSRFQICQLAKYMQLAEAQEKGLLEALYSTDNTDKTSGSEELPSQPRGFDLNIVSVPDLNEEFTPPRDSSGGEDNGVPLELLRTEADNDNDDDDDDDAASNGTQKNLIRSDGTSDDSQGTGEEEDEPEFDFLTTRKRKANSSSETETHESDSSPPEDNLKKCAKMIWWLEREGLIEKRFRVRFLSWLGLNSTAHEQCVVSTFIETLADDPRSLAGQLLHAFSDILYSKRPKNGCCSSSKVLE